MADLGSSNSDSEPEQSKAGVTAISERRQRHDAILAAWIQENLKRLDAEESKPTTDSIARSDEELSIQDLMARTTDRKIIESPRDYQLELFERAKERNTIAVLDTGSGKTLIAALLIRWVFDEELALRARGCPHRITFFVVGSVALTFQQWGVLSCNLDQKIVQLYGEKKVDLFTHKEWEKIFEANMGVVCTADVLYQCLTRSFIRLSDINLLIFDEAHHAKKDHSFSRIMRDHYHRCPMSQRPRIFGMTASPVDAKADIVQAAQELETTLDAQIATARDLKLLSSTVSRPEEHVLYYAVLRKPYSTALCHTLQQSFAQSSFFNKYLTKARLIASELGEWCADRYWDLCLSEDAEVKMENDYKRELGRARVRRPVEHLNQDFALIETARAVIREHFFPTPDLSTGKLISSKVERLGRFLASEFATPTPSKCIVFVNNRQIAMLLADLFRRIGTVHLRPAPMVGTRVAEAGETPFSLGTQIRTLAKFDKGELNCLFATSIAEEGLDVAECNIIVRYDLYNTMIQYIQSRGRARHRNSKYIHMLEFGNNEHDERLKLARDSETEMRAFCSALPNDRILMGAEADLDDDAADALSSLTYTEKATGATFSYHSSLTLLHHFVDCLPHDTGVLLQPTYIMQAFEGHFQCEVILPDPSPIKSVMGNSSLRKSVAKRSAAFLACRLLRQKGFLDSHLMPIYTKSLPLMRNAQLALEERVKETYRVRLKPTCWGRGWGNIPSMLYVTVIDLSVSGCCGRPHTPLLLLTREELLDIPEFPVWPQANTKAEAICTRLLKGLVCSREELEALTVFTLRIYSDIFAKEYEKDETKMSYWLAPALALAGLAATTAPEQVIDRETLELVRMNDHIKWRADLPPQYFVDRFVIDPLAGGRRFYTEAVDAKLKPLDPPPEGVAANRWKANILEYSFSLWNAEKRAQHRFDVNQPVFKASRLLFRRSLFQPWGVGKEDMKTSAYICLEPLRMSALPTRVVAMAWLLPAFIWRIESHLIAQEACVLLGLNIKPSLALEALTKDSDNTEEHRAQQINVQRGMGRNYERLEFIGDSFLKMATSIALFTQNAGDDEFESHVKRMMMICNRNLLNTGVELGLYEYIRCQGFNRRTWYPEGIKLLKGKGAGKESNEDFKKSLSKKTIADVCEAFIGAALLSYEDTGNMDMAVRAVTATVSQQGHEMVRWSEYYEAYHKPDYQTSQATAAQIDLVKKVQAKDSYSFISPRLLQSAFTHPSYPFSWDRIPHYQRLEFLGDALFDMVCVNFLYKRHPDRDPQWLTEHKMAMVSNKFLGALCVKLGFHGHLRSNYPLLMSQVKGYVDEITDEEKGSGGAVDYWTNIARDPPKCLPDIVEAYLGALFVDSEYNFHQIERFFDEHVAYFFQDMAVYDTFANNHPIIALSQLLTQTYECQDFRVLSREVPVAEGKPTRVCSVVIIHDRIVADAWSNSSRYGKMKAAGKGRSMIEGLAPAEFKKRFMCSCAGSAPGLELLPVEERLGSAI